MRPTKPRAASPSTSAVRLGRVTASLSARAVAADGASAVHWFRRAANQGSAVARYNLGCCYLVGIGLPKSPAAARVYFAAAAAMGYAKAASALAALNALGAA